MKTLKQIGFVMLMGISTVMINGCAKDGAIGPAGVAGKNGNANVSTSNLTVAPSDWQADGSGGWKTSFTASGFNPTVGANEVFLSDDNVNWIAMPLTVSSDETIFYSFNATSLTIDDAMIGTNPISQPTGTAYFKIVNIPPAAMIAHPDVNLKNYMEVKATFNLQN